MKQNIRRNAGSTVLALVMALSVWDGAAADTPPDAAQLMKDITVLASDNFEGRSPGTHGEEMTVSYISRRFREVGLAPGNPDGTYVQKVGLSGFTATSSMALTVGGKTKELAALKDFVALSFEHRQEIAVKDSDLVFVGYGVRAPEFGWDDYKGVDVRGKTIVMLINDPQVPDPKDPAHLDEAVFGGKAMTYYGRWTYKYEMAAKLGAAAAIIIHETAPAAYPWSVVANSWGKENFALRSKGRNPDFPSVAAWIQLDRARELLSATGHDYDALKALANKRDFRPVELGATVSFDVKNKIREVESRNVIGKIPGADPALAGEYIIYSAHWDHFGWDQALPGEKTAQIYHGALDNASGVAALMDVATQFRAAGIKPKRTVLFIATTAEERGLLGARYYAQHPLYPLRRTLADINFDVVNPWGRTQDVEIIGSGKSTMDDLLTTAAAAQKRMARPDHRPEQGGFYRNDELELAKVGVPVLKLGSGREYIGKPADFGDRKDADFTAHDYHQVTDVVKSGWDLSGATEDDQLLFTVGSTLAAGAAYPTWKAGSEFKAARDKAEQH